MANYEYEVIKDFSDLQDKNHVYRTGDSFPRDGNEVTDERIKELSTTENKRKEALIALVEVEETNEKEIEENAIDDETKFDDLTVDELKELAKESEIVGYSKMKKVELIEALKE